MKKTILAGLVVMFVALATAFAVNDTDTSKAKKEDNITAYSKLNPDQILELEKEKLAADQDKFFFNSRLVTDTGSRIGVPIAFFLFILLIIFIVHFFRYKKRQNMNALYMKYLESGKDIPSELLQPTNKLPKSNLKRGFILLCLGVGIGLTLMLLQKETEKMSWALGFIPFFLGIGYLIVYKIEQKSKAQEGNQ